MAQPPPPTGSAAARSALAQKLSGVPPDYFVIKLYQMLQEQREVLTWDPDGGIIIHDRQRLEATLSVYFRHNRFTSFQRQLNNFGFHRQAGAGVTIYRRSPEAGGRIDSVDAILGIRHVVRRKAAAPRPKAQLGDRYSAVSALLALKQSVAVIA